MPLRASAFADDAIPKRCPAHQSPCSKDRRVSTATAPSATRDPPRRSGGCGLVFESQIHPQQQTKQLGWSSGRLPDLLVPPQWNGKLVPKKHKMRKKSSDSSQVFPMPRIVIPDDEPAVMLPSMAYKKLSGFEVRAYSSRPFGPDELIERIRDAEIVINIRATSAFTADVMESCSKLRLISIWGTGTDHVDLPAANTQGIRVTNTPGVSATAVADHTLGLIFTVAKNMVCVDQQVRQGDWPRSMVMQLRGKTLGLIGTGAIGREVAKLAQGIGMRVIAWTFHPSGDTAQWVSFEDVFRQTA